MPKIPPDQKFGSVWFLMMPPAASSIYCINLMLFVLQKIWQNFGDPAEILVTGGWTEIENIPNLYQILLDCLAEKEIEKIGHWASKSGKGVRKKSPKWDIPKNTFENDGKFYLSI
jgi:hypothetical protein